MGLLTLTYPSCAFELGIPLTAVCLRLIFKVDPNQMW